MAGRPDSGGGPQRPGSPFVVRRVHDAPGVHMVSRLFREYADTLGVDLGFQDFDTELARMPGDYAPPDGVLLMAFRAGQPAGCVGVRPLDGRCCEMKRLYVRAPFRRCGLGRRLAEGALSEAARLGYTHMRLDTLPTMVEAQCLYEGLGFTPIPAYRHNPVPGTSFLEVVLCQEGGQAFEDLDG